MYRSPGPTFSSAGTQKPDDVDLGQRRAHDVVEPLAEQRARLVQPRGVDQDQLGVVAVDDAADGVPRRLRPVGRDRDLLADQRVGQRRLAGVGTADEAGEPCAELGHSSPRTTA